LRVLKHHMAREAKLFDRNKGSPAKAIVGFTGNLPPNWIERAQASRKDREPAIAKAGQELRQLRKKRPNARATIKAADVVFRHTLREWELAYRKECFYRGIRALLELQRDGNTRL
jgi:hypothetical protein